jgi:uncharacterized phage protein (TIGR02218 family)
MSDPWLAGPVTSAAYGWQIERGDGVALGFTSHDRDVVIDGLMFQASPGMRPTSIVESSGLETDGLEIGGALTSSAISADDLAAGRWDAARFEIFLFDWSNPAAGKRILTVGELGAVSRSDAAFEAEMLGLTRLLDQPVVPRTSPGCRASFGDAACGLNRPRFLHRRTVVTVAGETILLTPAITAGSFAYGQVRWLDGANAGLVCDVIANDANGVTLARLPHFAVTPGTRLELIEGCDKRLETCAARFGNAINFRGEPHLPGNDLLTRYPGAG